VKRVRSEIYTVRQYDYEKLRQLYKERTLGAEESKKHVLAMMQSVQEGMQRERIDMEIEEHLSSILNELDIVIEQQREYIDSESKLLSALHAIMGNREYRVRDADIIIKEVVKNFEGLKGALAGEKIRVAMPFEKFLQHKRTIKERTEAYQEKGMITKEEIFRDLRTMRTASEAAAYINWLSKFLMAMIRNPEISEKEKAQLQRLWGWLSRANQKAIEKTEINLNYQKRISERDDKFDILGKRAFYAKLSDLIYKYEKGTRAAKKKKKIESILENLNIAEEKKDAGNLRFTMAVFDIDNFKTYNDFYNYEIGDDVIRKIIDLVKKSVQKTDFFAKYGGEEFAIIFEGIEKEKILNRIDQIRDHIFRNTIYFMQKINNKFRQKIESEFHKEIAIQGLDEFLSFSNLVKKVANMDRGAKIPMPYVSVSIGIAEFPKDAHTAKGIKKEAEELQKKAKETGYNFWNIRFSGRNQVCIKTDGKIKCLNPENSIYKEAGEIKKAA